MMPSVWSHPEVWSLRREGKKQEGVMDREGKKDS